MKLHIHQRELLVWGFVVIVAGLSVNLVLESREYVLMYSSIDQVQFTILSMALKSNGPSDSIVLVHLRADNPVDYAGLIARVVDVSAFFGASSSYLFKARPLYSTLTNQALIANGATSLVLTITMSQQNGTSLESFYQAHNGNITANAYIDASVTTQFFLAIGTSPIVFLKQQNVTLT